MQKASSDSLKDLLAAANRLTLHQEMKPRFSEDGDQNLIVDVELQSDLSKKTNKMAEFPKPDIRQDQDVVSTIKTFTECQDSNLTDMSCDINGSFTRSDSIDSQYGTLSCSNWSSSQDLSSPSPQSGFWSTRSNSQDSRSSAIPGWSAVPCDQSQETDQPDELLNMCRNIFTYDPDESNNQTSRLEDIDHADFTRLSQPEGRQQKLQKKPAANEACSKLKDWLQDMLKNGFSKALVSQYSKEISFDDENEHYLTPGTWRIFDPYYDIEADDIEEIDGRMGKDGLPEGKALVTLKNGVDLFGSWKNGVRNCGKIGSTSGSHLEKYGISLLTGNYSYGMLHGLGRGRLSNGMTFEGLFNSGFLEGPVVMRPDKDFDYLKEKAKADRFGKATLHDTLTASNCPRTTLLETKSASSSCCPSLEVNLLASGTAPGSQCQTDLCQNRSEIDTDAQSFHRGQSIEPAGGQNNRPTNVKKCQEPLKAQENKKSVESHYIDFPECFIGVYDQGLPTGLCWQLMEGGGWIHGKVDVSGKFSGENIMYIFPDMFTCIVGNFEDGLLVEGRLSYIEKVVFNCEIYSAIPNSNEFDHHIYKHSPANQFDVTVEKTHPDPYESDRVEIQNSNIDGAGDGLFAARDIEEGEVVSFYHGVYYPVGVRNPNTCHNYQIFLDWNRAPKSSHLDVPLHLVEKENYCASLGHKANHSFTPNCCYTPFFHPVFGSQVLALKTLRPLKKGEELTCNYRYDVNDAPDWYFQMFN